jgi:hypothetical protein
MRIGYKIVSFILVYISVFNTQTHAQMKQIFVDGGVELTVPDTLKLRPRVGNTDLGDIILYQYYLRKEIHGQIVKFAFQFCDYPEGTLHHDSLELIQLFYEATAEESAKSVLGKLEYSSTVDILGYPGLVWRVSFDKDKGLIKSKAFVKGRRYYNLKVEYPRKMSLDPVIDQFLDSIKWIE